MGKKWPGIPEQEIEGFIAEGTTLSGELVLDGGYRIDGRVSGKIEAGSTLIVGPPGEIDAEDLRATNLLVSGIVRGNLHVRDRLEIQPGGKVYGDVTMKRPGLVLSTGGLFEGKVNMQPDPESTSKKTEAEPAEESDENPPNDDPAAEPGVDLPLGPASATSETP